MAKAGIAIKNHIHTCLSYFFWKKYKNYLLWNIHLFVCFVLIDAFPKEGSGYPKRDFASCLGIEQMSRKTFMKNQHHIYYGASTETPGANRFNDDVIALGHQIGI